MEKYCVLWYVCKYFIEENCEGECGCFYSFFVDKGNWKNMIEVGFENFLDEFIRNIVVYSLF